MFAGHALVVSAFSAIHCTIICSFSWHSRGEHLDGVGGNLAQHIEFTRTSYSDKGTVSDFAFKGVAIRCI